MAHPDKDIALAALAANHGNAKKTAIQLGMPLSTLRYWAGRSNAHGNTPSPNLAPEKRGELADNWTRVALRSTAIALEAMEHLDPEKLRAGDVKHLLIGGAVATDKAQLLTGGATSRTESLRIALVGAADLRTLSAQIAHKALPAGEVVEAEYSELAEGA